MINADDDVSWIYQAYKNRRKLRILQGGLHAVLDSEHNKEKALEALKMARETAPLLRKAANDATLLGIMSSNVKLVEAGKSLRNDVPRLITLVNPEISRIESELLVLRKDRQILQDRILFLKRPWLSRWLFR